MFSHLVVYLKEILLPVGDLEFCTPIRDFSVIFIFSCHVELRKVDVSFFNFTYTIKYSSTVRK